MTKRASKSVKMEPPIAAKNARRERKAALDLREARDHVEFLVQKFFHPNYFLCGNEDARIKRAIARSDAAQKNYNALLGSLPTEPASAQLSVPL